MNDNMQGNTNNSENVTPYRASGNLNTLISNPSVNINDTMNVNIQNMVTSSPKNNSINTNVVENSNLQNYQNQNIGNNNANLNSTTTTNNNNNNANNVNNVNRTYVSADNRPKKKKLMLNLGPEFKIALLIVVILLVFIFILPMISSLFK